MDTPKKVPNLNVPMNEADETLLRETRSRLESEHGKRLALAEVVRIAIRELHKQTAKATA